MKNKKNNFLLKKSLKRLHKLGFTTYLNKNNIIVKIDWLINQSDETYGEVNEILFLLNANPTKKIKLNFLEN